MKVLIGILVLMYLIGYISIKSEKYAGLRRILPTVLIFFLCIFMVICFLDMFRCQVGFSEFFRNLFFGFRR